MSGKKSSLPLQNKIQIKTYLFAGLNMSGLKP